MDVFWLGFRGRGAWCLWQVLMVEETNRLRHAVLGNREVLSGQAFDRAAFLVCYHYRFHD